MTTPTLWEYDDGQIRVGWSKLLVAIRWGDGENDWRGAFNDDADGERAVACVNAMAKIEDPAAFMAAVHALFAPDGPDDRDGWDEAIDAVRREVSRE